MDWFSYLFNVCILAASHQLDEPNFSPTVAISWSEPLRVDKKLSNADSWREVHEEDQAALRPRLQDISIAELEAGKPLAQIAREYGVHPSLPSRWRDELAENPERAFSGNGNRCKYEAGLQSLRGCLARLMPRMPPPGSQ